MNQNLFARLARKSLSIVHRCVALSAPVLALAMMLMVSVSSSVAMAQSELRPPKAPSNSEGAPKYMILFISVLLVGGVVFAATFRSKRTHQD